MAISYHIICGKHYRRVASTPGATVDFEALNLPRGDELEKRGANTVASYQIRTEMPTVLQW